MKKVFYSIAVISAMMFASCSEDRGTTHEVADANQDENVNPNQIRGYGDSQTAAAGMGTEADWIQNAERVSSQMASDLQLTPETQTRVQKVLFERERRISELESDYNYTETNRMGGQTDNDTRNDMKDNQSTDMDANRSNNQGNAYEGNSNMNDGEYNNLQQTESELNSERELINADTDRELQSILTPEQYRQYEQNRVNYMGANPSTGTTDMDNSGNMNNQNNNMNKPKSGNNDMKRN